jgi:EAL domain-containing protein (putative c-di-GMP-specific phosphodiesterase class I)
LIRIQTPAGDTANSWEGVIAEGVETEEQLSLLAQEGCNLYQDFLCSRPVDAEALAKLVEK